MAPAILSARATRTRVIPTEWRIGPGLFQHLALVVLTFTRLFVCRRRAPCAGRCSLGRIQQHGPEHAEHHDVREKDEEGQRTHGGEDDPSNASCRDRPEQSGECYRNGCAKREQCQQPFSAFGIPSRAVPLWTHATSIPAPRPGMLECRWGASWAIPAAAQTRHLPIATKSAGPSLFHRRRPTTVAQARIPAHRQSRVAGGGHP